MKAFQLIIISLSILAASCGWQVRGTALNAVLQISALEYESAVSPGLSRTLDRAFVVASLEEGPEYMLSIVNEIQFERIQSVTESLHTGQLRMEKRVQYRISDLNGGRIETGTALVWRDLDQDEFNPGATERERTFLQNEIDADIVQQLLRHLERFSINNGGNLAARRNAAQG
jgi:outer membrane lipopolysaccharide assembly protein LptE/RlpB|tara:strand:+ start:20903 stop:21421 length:519 start_codon:yes stop_codon:yes gene_type:complete